MCVANVTSVMSNSVRPHKWQPTRLLCPWDSPGKNIGVGCHFPLQCTKVKTESEAAQSCPTLSVLFESEAWVAIPLNLLDFLYHGKMHGQRRIKPRPSKVQKPGKGSFLFRSKNTTAKGFGLNPFYILLSPVSTLELYLPLKAQKLIPREVNKILLFCI